MNLNCYSLLYLGNLQEQVKKSILFQKLYWPLTVQMNCSSDLKNFIYLFLAFSLKFQKVFSIARAFFFHSRSEQNTIPMAHSCDKLQKTRQKLVKLTDYPYACNIFTIIFLYILNVFFKVHPITSHPRSCVVKTTLFLWTGGPLVSFSTKC